MAKPISILLFSSLFFHAQCSPSAPEITAPAVLRRTLDNDPAFRGYTSTLGSWSPLYCFGDYTYSEFGNIADCCTVNGICHPATECGTDYEGSTRAIMYQGGETLTCYDTTCGTQTIYKTKGDSDPLSIIGCFAGGDLYLTTPGSPELASATNSAAPSGTAQSSQPTSSSDPSSTAVAAPATKSTTNVGIIAGGAAVGVVLLLAIAGLIAWVIILKKRNAKKNSGPNTELQKMQGAGPGPTDGSGKIFKAELPTNEGWAVEMSPESAPPSRQEQKPWSNLNATPLSPASTYSAPPAYQGAVSPLTPVGVAGPGQYPAGNNGQYGGMAEFPGSTTHYQELPATTRPQYAELR